MSDTVNGSSSVRLQIISDIHLEFGWTTEQLDKYFVPQAPILCLLGDIGYARNADTAALHDNSSHDKCTGPLADLLRSVCPRFERVLFLAGNHENWGTTFQGANDWLKRLEQEISNFTFLNQTSLSIAPGIRILGATLWTRIPNRYARDAFMRMADFDNIQDYQEAHEIFKRWKQSPTDYQDQLDDAIRDCIKHHNRMFEQDCDWLSEKVEAFKERGELVVVLTHHSPLPKDTLKPYEMQHPVTVCTSATNLSGMFDNVDLWAFGHTHWNVNLPKEVHGTRLVSNALGYPNEEQEEGFKPCQAGFVVTLATM